MDLNVSVLKFPGGKKKMFFSFSMRINHKCLVTSSVM